MFSLAKQVYFNEWQNENIFTKKYGDISINSILNYFIDELELFLRKNGYNINISSTVLGNNIATLLYRLDFNRFYLFPISNKVVFDDKYDHFNYIIDWATFWKYWNQSTNNFFYEAEIHIEHIIWSYVNFETSQAHIDYMEMLEESDNEEMSKKIKIIDPYLLDQINASNHYKFTRFENS